MSKYVEYLRKEISDNVKDSTSVDIIKEQLITVFQKFIDKCEDDYGVVDKTKEDGYITSRLYLAEQHIDRLASAMYSLKLAKGLQKKLCNNSIISSDVQKLVTLQVRTLNNDCNSIIIDAVDNIEWIAHSMKWKEFFNRSGRPIIELCDDIASLAKEIKTSDTEMLSGSMVLANAINGKTSDILTQLRKWGNDLKLSIEQRLKAKELYTCYKCYEA